MIRVVKEAEIRRKELLDISEKFLIKKGYDGTTVEDIIKEANIAKGTFYHYFKSKDDVLRGIVDRYMASIIDIMERVVNNNEINAVQKIVLLFNISAKHRSEHKETENLIDIVHDEKNWKFHHELESKNTPIFEEFFERIVTEGVNEGVFHTDYPKETAIALVSYMSAIGHGPRKNAELSIEEKIDYLKAFLYMMERLLGTEKGAFDEVFKLLEEYK